MHGVYYAICYDRDGRIKWAEEYSNLITIEGKNFFLDTLLSSPAYQVMGPYLGLIGSTGYTVGPQDSDTAGVHPGWQEAGNYSAGRALLTFSAAAGGTKTASSPATFNITSSDSIKGSCLFLGTGVSSTPGSPSGILYSAGNLTSGDRGVGAGDSISITWSTSL